MKIIVPKYFIEDEVEDLDEPLRILNEEITDNKNEIEETAEKHMAIEEQIDKNSKRENDFNILENKKDDVSKAMGNQNEIKTDFVDEGKPPKKKTRFSSRRRKN